MALNNDTNFPPSGLAPYRIDRTWCLGDSLPYLNANFTNFDSRIETLSSNKFDKTGGTITGGLTATGNVTATGNIITPNRPAFSATLGSGTYTASTTVDILWDTIQYNIGSCYNASTGRFTAPVAGIYHFYATFLPAPADTGDFRIALIKNGSTTDNFETFYKNIGGVFQQLRITRSLQLLAGDFITVRYWSGGGSGIWLDPAYNYFQGHLISQLT